MPQVYLALVIVVSLSELIVGTREPLQIRKVLDTYVTTPSRLVRDRRTVLHHPRAKQPDILALSDV